MDDNEAMRAQDDGAPPTITEGDPVIRASEITVTIAYPHIPPTVHGCLGCGYRAPEQTTEPNHWSGNCHAQRRIVDRVIVNGLAQAHCVECYAHPTRGWAVIAEPLRDPIGTAPRCPDCGRHSPVYRIEIGRVEVATVARLPPPPGPSGPIAHTCGPEAVTVPLATLRRALAAIETYLDPEVMHAVAIELSDLIRAHRVAQEARNR